MSEMTVKLLIGCLFQMLTMEFEVGYWAEILWICGIGIGFLGMGFITAFFIFAGTSASMNDLLIIGSRARTMHYMLFLWTLGENQFHRFS